MYLGRPVFKMYVEPKLFSFKYSREGLKVLSGYFFAVCVLLERFIFTSYSRDPTENKKIVCKVFKGILRDSIK